MKTQLHDFHKTLIENSFSPIIVRDQEGHILTWNCGASELYGYTREEAEGKNIHDLLKTVFPVSCKDVDDHLKQNGMWQGELTHTTSNGNEVSVDSQQQYFVQTDGSKLVLEMNRLNPHRARLHFLFGNMQEGISHCRVIYDVHNNPVDWVYLETNPALEQIHGIQNLKGKRARELFPQLFKLNPEIPELFGKVARTGNAEHFEGYVDALGKWLRMEISSPERDHIFIVGEDITGRKEAEAELRESEDKLRRILLDTDAIGVLIFNYDGVLIDANDVFLRMFGYVRSEIKSSRMTWRMMTPAEWIPESEAQMKKFAQTGRIGPYEKEYLRKDGSKAWMLFTGRDLGDGTILEYAIDITSHKEMEVALRKEMMFAESLIETAQAIVLVLDTDARIVRFNPYMEALSGYRLDEVKNMDWFTTFLPERNQKQTHEVFKQAIHDKRTQGNINSIVTKDGYELQIKWYDKTLKDENGRVIGLLVIGYDISDQVRAEKVLQQSEEKYRSLFDNMAEQVMFWKLVRDDDGNIKTWCLIDVNPAALKSWRKKREETVGRYANEIFPGATEHFMPIVRKIFNEGASYSWETYFPETKEYLMMTSVPLGEYFITTGSDVSVLKQAQRQFQLSEERFRGFFENVAIGTAILDPEGHFLRVNDRFCAITGYSREELLGGMKPLDLSHPDEHEKEEKRLEHYYREKMPHYEVEKRYLRKEGGIVWVKVSASTVLDDEGKIFYSAGVIEDITDRKIAESALIKSEARFQKIFNESPTGIAIKDMYGRVEKCNSAYIKMLGYSEEELGSMLFSEMVHPDDRRKNMTEVKRLLAGEIDFFEIENRYINKNGKIVWVHKFSSLLPSSEGESVHIIVMTTDITHRKEAEQLLEMHGDEMARLYRIGTVNELASGLAHELSQPLTAIQNYAGGCLKMLEAGKGDDRIKPALHAINEQSQRLVDVIQHLRHLMQAGTPQKKKTNIETVVRKACELLDIPLSRKHIRIDVKTEARIPELFVDSLQIEQVLIILIRNCIDAFANGYILQPIIEIRISYQDDRIFIEVADNGPGVTPEQLKRFFQPFYTTKMRGTGLGLMLARRLVMIHQGEISAYLPDSGGLTVKLILPVKSQ